MRVVHGVTAAVTAVLLLAAPGRGAAPPSAQEAAPLRDDDVVARVNGTPIYRKAVREVVQGALAAQDSEPPPNAIAQLAADALDSLIDFDLLYQESIARNVTVADAAVDEEMTRTKSHFPDPGTFRKVLASKGMSEADLRRDTQKSMAVNRFLEGVVFKDLRVKPEQVQAFYEQNQAEFKHPPQIRASHILIRVPEKATPAQREAARKTATRLLAELKTGADFAQLAREKSEDPGSAPQGGDLGYFAKGDMVEAFEQHAFAMPVGELSEVVSTPYGFHVILVTARRDAGVDPLDEVQSRITAVLMKSERRQRQAEFVAALRQKAKIEYGAPL